MDIKRIETQKEKEKRDRRNKVAIGIILVTLMVLSTAGYAITDRGKTSKMKYNGFNFEKTDNGWYMKNDQIELLTSFNPLEVKNISYNKGFASPADFTGSVFVDALGVQEKQAANEILKNLPVSRVQLACLKEEENLTGCAELPIKSCSNDTILIVKTANNTEIINNEKCIVIYAENENLLKAADRFLFGIYSIITG